MFTQIKIFNFQTHKKVVLDLDRGVNTIIGPSDVGKSAIIRAIRWLVFNEPNGDAYRSSWGGKTMVVVKTSDGHTIRRVRTDKDNYYKLDDETFRAFGRGVPEPIQKVLNMNIGNFQQQMDMPFLLSRTPTEVARELNEVANLKEIDNTLSVAGSYIREAQTGIRVSNARISDLEDELEEFEDLDAWETAIVRIEKLTRQVNGIRGRQSSLAGLLRQINTTSKQLEELPSYPKGISKKVKTVLDWIEREKKYRLKKEKLESLLSNIHTTMAEKDELSMDITSLENTYHELTDGETCPLCGNNF